MYPPVFDELAKIRAQDLRRDADPRPRRARRPRRPRSHRLRRVVGSGLVSVGTRMMREVA